MIGKKIKDFQMFKIMTILGTRPEIIKMSRVVYEFDQCFKQILVYTVKIMTMVSKIFFDELVLENQIFS